MRIIYLKIVLLLIFLLLFSLITATYFIISFSRHDFNTNLKNELHSSAVIISELVKAKGIEHTNPGELDVLIKKIGRELNMRITLIGVDGVVLADSNYEPQKMENHSNRPEVREALQGRVGSDKRMSESLHSPMTYLAKPIWDNEKLWGIVRVALFEKQIERMIKGTIYKSVVLGALISGLIAIIISLYIARRYSRPIEIIRNSAAKISHGDFSYRLPVRGRDELSQLTESINNMSFKLGQYFESLNEEKERISAILGGMKEQLILIGGDELIYSANTAFCLFFDYDSKRIVGKPYREVIKEEELRQFIMTSLHSQKMEYCDYSLKKNGKPLKYYRLSSSPIITQKGGFRGIVVIFHDITLMRELEKMRRDFFDNASHELKTPLSTIIGVSETLIDKEPVEGEVRHKFYNNIYTNAQRLHNLIDDILALSEIEQKKVALQFAEHSISDIIREVVVDLSVPLKSRRHQIKLDLPVELPLVMVDRKSMIRAFGNILDNAIKYTDGGGLIQVRAALNNETIKIEFEDNGSGIPPEDIDRIFERFYCVDKARSMKSGGTGLGLAITKQIMEAHEGKIEVTSLLGKGSVFSITLPLK